VAARADHNPLLLADLLRIVRANGFELTEAHTEHLARLPQGFQKIYQAVWSVFLSEAARAHLQLAAALGMPVHEGLLRMGATAVPAAQPTDLAAHAQDPLDEALRAGWLTAVADPFSDDRTLHFSERVMHDVASAFAVELLEPTRCNAVNRVARAALELDATSSSVARLDALRYAARLCLSDLTRPAALHLPMLICEIGRLHWERDRSEGADWLRSAVRCAAKFESPDLDQIAASAADAFTNLDRFDEALEMLALGGDPLLGHVVYVLNVADRYDDVAVAAQRALDVELPRRGVLLFIGRIGREHVVAEIAELALDAAVRTQDADLKQRAVAVARRAIDDALDRELWAEAAEIADAGIQAESFDRNDLAAFEARGMPTVSTMTPQELLESPLVERDAVGELVERLVADDYDGAADSASHIDTPEELTEALPHLHRLIEQGGPNYWYDLGAAALYVGDHATAVDALERAVTHHRSQFAETDHEVQRIAFAFARALVGHEDFERGAAVARRAVEVAEAVGNDRLLAEALWVRVETLTAAGALSDADAYADLQRLWALMISGGMQLFPMVRVFDPVACALLRTANDRGDREQMAAISGELRDLILPPSFYLELAAWRLVALWQTDPAVVLHTASLLAANHGLPAADTARDRLGRLAADGAQAIHEALTSSTRTLYDLMDELPPWSRLLTGDHGVTAWSERLVVCGAIAQERRMLADWPVLAAEQRSVALAVMGQAWADVAAVLGAPTYLAEALLARYQGAGRTEEAIVIIGPLLATCERRLNACVRLLGPEHPDTLRTRDDLATVYQAAGRTADAKRVHRAAP
jgi:tetratricopeptide (TPR) repeat protein